MPLLQISTGDRPSKTGRKPGQRAGVPVLQRFCPADILVVVRSAILILVLAVSTAFAQVKITPGKDVIRVDIGGKPFTEFVMSGPEVGKPYLFPLRTARGTTITRNWPMIPDVPGEPHDHPHHRGLWFSHGDVNGFDFWMDAISNKRPNAGKILPAGAVSIKQPKNATDSGSITADFNWTAPNGDVLIREERTMTFWPDPVLRIVDFDIKLTARQKVTFGDTKEGTFALRLRPELQEDKGSGHILNAEGGQTEKNDWGKRSNWVDYSGKVGDEAVGIAIFDHPSNPRHPVRWHVRAYGLFAANPFGLAEFVGDKSQSGAMTLEPGESLRFRYRVVIHPGEPESGIANLYKQYAEGDAPAPAAAAPGQMRELIDGFRLVEVASVADAIEQLYGAKMYMSHDMRPLFLSKFAGPAVTVMMKKEEHKEGSAASSGMLDAIDQAPPGSVYVMVVEDGLDIAGMGALMGTAMKFRGLAGAVIDGGLRDTPQMKRIQFPVYSRSIVPSTSVNHYRFAGMNVPVKCAGVPVRPNDIIVADEDGVAVVPLEKAAEVLKRAQELDDTEHRMLPFIEKYKSIKEAVAKFGRI